MGQGHGKMGKKRKGAALRPPPAPKIHAQPPTILFHPDPMEFSKSKDSSSSSSSAASADSLGNSLKVPDDDIPLPGTTGPFKRVESVCYWAFRETVDIHRNYEFKRSIQAGGYGECIRATRRIDGKMVAIKLVKKKPANLSRLRSEVMIYQSLDYKHIAKFLEYYEDGKYVYIVMEFCGGGDLFDRIASRKKFTENDARKLFIQMVEGVQYLHNHKIAHYDLKPDNFVITDEPVFERCDHCVPKVLREYLDMLVGSDNRQLVLEFYTPPDAKNLLKIIDFGLSEKFKEGRDGNGDRYHHGAVGTPYYQAPEMLKANKRGSYYEASDIWSLGVILFIMLTGIPPFNTNKGVDATTKQGIEQIRAKIMSGFKPNQRFREVPAARNLSVEVKDLISKILISEPHRRLTVDEVLRHPWMQSESINSVAAVLSPDVLKDLKKFNNHGKLAHLILSNMVDILTPTEVSQIANIVDRYTNADGKIPMQALRNALNEAPLANKALRTDTFESMKLLLEEDDNEYFDRDDFEIALIRRKVVASEERLWQAFKKLDKHGRGTLSAEDIITLIPEGKEAMDVEELRTLIQGADLNGDGEIDYKEFLDLWGVQKNSGTGPLLKKKSSRRKSGKRKKMPNQLSKLAVIPQGKEPKGQLTPGTSPPPGIFFPGKKAPKPPQSPPPPDVEVLGQPSRGSKVPSLDSESDSLPDTLPGAISAVVSNAPTELTPEEIRQQALAELGDEDSSSSDSDDDELPTDSLTDTEEYDLSDDEILDDLQPNVIDPDDEEMTSQAHGVLSDPTSINASLLTADLVLATREEFPSDNPTDYKGESVTEIAGDLLGTLAKTMALPEGDAKDRRIALLLQGALASVTKAKGVRWLSQSVDSTPF